MADSVRTAAAFVTAAWENAGPVPEYHRYWQIKLHEEWPVLADAVEQLVAAVRRENADG